MKASQTARLGLALLISLPLFGMSGPVMAEDYAKRFPAQWLEDDGHIRLDTICYNYPRQSHMYPLCRLQALTRLEDSCDRYQALTDESSDQAMHQHFSNLTDKYCIASKNYRQLLSQQGFLQE